MADTELDNLIALLEDRDPQIQHRAIDEFLAKADSELIENMLEMIRTNRRPQRTNASNALHILTAKVKSQQTSELDWLTTPLLQALNDPQLEVRRSAIWGVQNLRLQKAVSPLIDLLQVNDVRIYAAYALGIIGNSTATDFLFQHIHDKNIAFAWTCTASLARLKDKRAFEPLIETAVSKDTHPDIRNDAIEELLNLADKRTQPKLLSILRDSKSSEVRAHVAQALTEIGDAQGIEPLTVALQDTDFEVRLHAIWAIQGIRERHLGEFSEEHLVTQLTSRLHDEYEDVRSAAILALRQTFNQRAVEPLISMLHDKSGHIRWMAVLALRDLGNEKAIKPLTSMIGDKDLRVREAVIQTLKHLASDEKFEEIVGKA